jgi:uncharacterized protein YgiM (DUF1202 family)
VENKTNYNKIQNKEPRGQRVESSPVDETVNVTGSVETSTDNLEPKTGRAVVCNCKFLNIRTKPNINSKVLRVVEEGIELPIAETVNGWTHVFDFGDGFNEGYVMMEYIKEV